MEDRSIIRDIVTGEVDIDVLQDRILKVFTDEINTAITKDIPGNMRWSERLTGRHQIEFSNNVRYLPFLLSGTGLYGPRHQMICAKGMSGRNPKRVHVMAWKPRGGGEMIFRRCTRGMRPNPSIVSGIETGIADATIAVTSLFAEADRVIS
jgi:hypothetical protein